AAGFSMKDLERHVAAAKARRFWAVEQRELAQELGAKHRAAQTTADELARELNRLRVEYETAIEPLLPKHRAAAEEAHTFDREGRRLTSQIPNELRRTLPVDWAVGLDVLTREREEVLGRLPPLLKRRGELQAELKKGKALEYRLESSETEQARAKVKAELAAHKRVQEQYEAVDRQYKQLQQEAMEADTAIRAHDRMVLDWRTINFETQAEEAARREQEAIAQEARRQGHQSIGTPVVGG
ncbi:MAG: hypothetical protein ABIP48_28445, partial [Planctomycetota bacterium]